MNDLVSILEYNVCDVREHFWKFAQENKISVEAALPAFVALKMGQGFSFPSSEKGKSFYKSLLEE